MNRRNFLRTLLGASAVAAAPKYFFAPIRGWKSDVIVNPNETTMTTYLVGSDALVSIDLQETLQVYYNRKFSENLKMSTVLALDAMNTRTPLPELRNVEFRTFHRAPINADRQNKNF